MKIFGDDGFRSRFGERFMTRAFLTAFAHAMADYCAARRVCRPVVIGRDPRASGRRIERWITTALLRRGVDVRTIGMVPTPVLSYGLRAGVGGLGIMITASHNPADDNGIKLFAATGHKLDAATEAAIEVRLRHYLATPRRAVGGRRGRRTAMKNLAARYVAYVRSALPLPRALPRILIDCSNGACGAVARLLFARYPTVILIHDQPNGSNINAGCGALEPARLLARVRAANAAFGAAFDGDGDRCIFVHRDYGPIETEKLLVLFAVALRRGRRGAAVVATEICNKALEWNLRRLGFRLWETPVGDRNVVEAVIRRRALLGAEPSGHFFFPRLARSMDGLVACIHFLRSVAAHAECIEQVRSMEHFRRITMTIPVPDASPADCAAARARVTRRLHPDHEKCVVRPSMWDPVVRLYYDYRARNRFAFVKKLVAAAFPNL